MLTGRHVLYAVLGFFGVIFVANGIFVYYALSTFSGLDVPRPYEQGREFNEELAAARAQAARGWKVDVKEQRNSDGHLSLRVTPRDQNGQALSGLTVSIRLRRPTQSALDRTLALQESGIGIYQGEIALPALGNWEMDIAARQGGKQVYLSRNRIVLK